ncbi:FAD dependent oxidoreductase [Pilobolus umbonatus]|nr:FAD dependent oxidoreductase [Pilobolus umbonatus]
MIPSCQRLFSGYRVGSRRLFSTLRAPDLEVDNIVIGAGVVGLAIGERLTRERSHEVTFVVEKNKRIGEETSARNSEVIHAGLYYPEDSLKTRLCIQGNRMLYQLLEKTTIPYRRIGKWVVAQDESQEEYLRKLHSKAERLGVETYFMGHEEAKTKEPHVQLQSALVSPTTGIVDSHSYMEYLSEKISESSDIALCTKVKSISPHDQGYLLEIATPADSDNTTSVLAKRVFNAGGLHADKISNMIVPDKYKLYYAKGNYFAYNAPLEVHHLIYPCPEKNLAGLGTHLTMDLAGGIKFGPDVEYVNNPYDYAVSDHNKQSFATAIRSYLPSLCPDKLHPDYSGIRPKLAGPGESFRDFIIEEEPDHSQFFSLIGIESPGLTASLAIADYVYEKIR